MKNSEHTWQIKRKKNGLDVDKEEHMSILRAQDGDSTAFEYLVKKFHRPIYQVCFSFTGGHQTADDLSQDTFIKAFFALDRFDIERSFYSWLRKIAVNASLNYLKRRKRERPLDQDVSYSGSSNSPPDELQKKRMYKHFHEALHSLPDDQKTIFILRTYEELSYEEISKLLKIPQGTVMSRLSRARNKLKSVMKEYL
jgi:RNA polymerase sigma-70 factor, ECF subfamily